MGLDRLQEMRKRRVQEVAKMIEEAGSLSLREFAARMSFEFGIRRQTLMEYLEDLEALGLIKVEGDAVKWVGRR
jgi:predicted ArsR family transcriptional regulator